jgi:uncharacterized membrane protein
MPDSSIAQSSTSRPAPMPPRLLSLRALGALLLPTALFALGVRSLIAASYIPGWQPTGDHRADPALVDVNAVVLIALSVLVVTGPRRDLAYWGLAILLLLWIALWQSAGIVAAPGVVVIWLGVAEVGALAVASALAANSMSKRHSVVLARYLFAAFGLCCVIFGISHFAYADFTSKMIPAWIPARLPLAYFTGGAHVAAGLAIASGVLRKLAAWLLACMMGVFVALVHVPAVVVTHGSLVEVTFLLNACALCGASIIVAHVATSLRTFQSDQGMI